MGRPFRGLREEPSSSYDVVVIGAGVGGLVCAILLAREGLKVLLVEQHYMVGGYCSTFRRKGYTFDAATHFYPLLGNPTTITGKLLQDVGVNCGWIKMDPPDRIHFPDGSSFSVPADFDTYVAKVKAEFPHEAAAFDEFLALARQAYLFGLLYYVRDRKTEWLDAHKDLTLRQVMDRYFRDPKLRLLLAGDCGHWGSPPSRTSFLVDSMLRFSYFLGNYYPEGGSQAFADDMARRFEQLGGHILMSSQVTRILTENKAACGIEVLTGSGRSRRLLRVYAGAIVSNADLRLTLEQLLSPEVLDPGYLEAVRELRPSWPCFLTHIGLRDITTETLRDVEGYHGDRWDIDEVQNFGYKIFVPTLFEPRMAPPGGHIVIVERLPEVNYEAITDWGEHKASIERQTLADLERVMPGFSQKIVVCLSASAVTSYKYTLNYQGAMLGWEMSPDQLGERRPDIRGPLKNLYLVGHWTKPGGGITLVMISAMQAAQMICGSVDTSQFLPSFRRTEARAVEIPG